MKKRCSLLGRGREGGGSNLVAFHTKKTQKEQQKKPKTHQQTNNKQKNPHNKKMPPQKPHLWKRQVKK